MFWKMYFWILAVLYVLYVIAAILLPSEMQLEAVDYVDICFAIVALVGVFGFSFKKVILNPNVWKLYLPFIILWDIGYSFVRSDLGGGEKLMFEVVALAIMAVILLPQYVAIYLYGFRSQLLWTPYNKSLNQDAQ